MFDGLGGVLPPAEQRERAAIACQNSGACMHACMHATPRAATGCRHAWGCAYRRAICQARKASGRLRHARVHSQATPCAPRLPPPAPPPELPPCPSLPGKKRRGCWAHGCAAAGWSCPSAAAACGTGRRCGGAGQLVPAAPPPAQAASGWSPAMARSRATRSTVAAPDPRTMPHRAPVALLRS